MFNSHPTKCLLLKQLATAVVPLPEKQSNTISPSFECFSIKFFINSTGFCVGWNLPLSWQIGKLYIPLSYLELKTGLPPLTAVTAISLEFVK